MKRDHADRKSEHPDESATREARELAADYEAHLEALNRELESRAREAELRTQQLQALTLQLTHAEHSERRRIARFIHDQLQQVLVTAKLQTVGLVGAPPAEVEQKAQRLQELLDSAIQRARGLSHELCPLILSDHGLAAALEWLAEEYRRDQVMDVRVEVDAELSLSEDLETFLFQAIRELLLNALKNGDATRVEVTLDQTAKAVRVAVEDNGSGDEVAQALPHQGTPGIGLSVMRERVDMLGGSMDVETAPGSGFRVGLYLPTGA
ncbi:sensor histidine kinase [Halofilum ochraceum]|uniref:sensor histidine kinase n=1 Tax=Halofilum ochraceum TaxID=1611323 RepID=UPI0008D9E031|nr:ATP-binding protein [Halofilum ochraceum]